MNRGQDEDRTGRLQRGKIIAMNYDAYNALPGDTCLYCLTDKQQMILIALLEQLGWRTRWYSPSGAAIDQDIFEGYRGDLAAALMSDVCSDIMTKLDTIIDKVNHVETMITTLETDLDASQLAQDVAIAGVLSEITLTVEPALIGIAATLAGIALQTTSIQGTVNEMSDDVDNIETVTTDPIDGLVEVSADVDAIELRVNKMQGQVTNITNNTIITLNIGIPDQTFSSDSGDTTLTENYARYNALCSAIVNWIYAEGYAVMSALNAPATDLSTIAAYIDAWANSLQYSMTGFLGSYIIADVYAALNDTTAVNDLACVMIGNLANLAPTSYSFTAALNGYTPPAYPDHHKILYDTLVIAINDLNGWQTLASILEPAYQDALAANPTSFDCPPCGAVSAFCGIPQTWDFTLGNKLPWLFQRGILQPGVGLVGQQIPGDLQFGLDMSIYFATPCTSIATHNIEIGHAHKVATGNAWTAEFYYLLAGVETRYNQSNRSQVAAWPTIDVDSFAIPTPPGGLTVGIERIRFYTNTPYYANAAVANSDACKITYVKFKT